MKDARLVIVTTRANGEALIRYLSEGYLSYEKDGGRVRDLMKDTERALQENQG